MPKVLRNFFSVTYQKSNPPHFTRICCKTKKWEFLQKLFSNFFSDLDIFKNVHFSEKVQRIPTVFFKDFKISIIFQ